MPFLYDTNYLVAIFTNNIKENDMISNNEILKNITELETANSIRLQKYRRNLRKYLATPGINIDTLTTNSASVGWDYSINTFSDGNTLSPPSINVIKSVVDTLVSKIATSKVRPFINTLNGSYKEMQTALQAQQFFDIFYEAQNVHMTVSKAFEDACIFDTGAIYIDKDTCSIKKCLPWQVYVLPAELVYNKLTRAYYKQTDYPVTLLPEDITKKFKKKVNYVDYGIYYDTFNKVKATIIAGHVVKTEPWDYDVLPFVFLYYSKPNIGTTSLSVVDILYTLQNEVDMIVSKISAAAELTPGNTIFLPEGGSVKATQLNNGVGNVLTYRPTPNMTGSPVTVATPAFIDGQYQMLLNELIQRAYELVGISQLSAMSQKPTGLDSGIALSTMESIESDRFETQLKQVINAYVDIARVCVELFDGDILPNSNRRLSINWNDIRKANDSLKIQFSAADALSKDPSVKLQQLQALAQSGIIPQSRIASLMELPDIQSGFSLANNAVNAVYAVINDCIENNNFELPTYVPFTLLKEEIINVQLSLKAANKKGNAEDIEKLQKLYSIVEDKELEFQKSSEEMAMEQANAEQGKGTNILEQEAGTYNMDNVPTEYNYNGADMDLSTSKSNWNKG